MTDSSKNYELRLKLKQVLPALLSAGYQDAVYEDYRVLAGLQLGELSEKAARVYNAWSDDNADIDALDADESLKETDDWVACIARCVAIEAMMVIEYTGTADSDPVDDLACRDLGWLSVLASDARMETVDMTIEVMNQKKNEKNSGLH